MRKSFSILIDAVFICRGGGYILLLDLAEKLTASQIKFKILVDSRISTDEKLKQYAVSYVKSSLLSREVAISKYARYYDVVLSFNNLPSIFYFNRPHFIYFHNVLYLKPASSFVFLLKKFIFLILSCKSNASWICQTKTTSNNLKLFFGRFKVNIDPVVIPFFPSLKVSKNFIFEKKTALRFVYVSDGHPYKNHRNLIAAFCALCDAGYNATLSLTVTGYYADILNLINSAAALGYPVDNFSDIPNCEMHSFLVSHDVAVYPSSFESFGLGLIEAAQCGLPIIASDRSFVYDVIRPLSVFNEESIVSILQAFEFCFSHDLIPSKLIISDNAGFLIDYLRGGRDVA